MSCLHMLWPVFHPITASLVHFYRTGCTNADCINHWPHHTGVKWKKKGSKTVIFSSSVLEPCQPFRETWLQHFLKTQGSCDTEPEPKLSGTHYIPSEGSLPWHNLMANLAITANSLFPQMSQWLGTWASMHMHTHTHTHIPGTIYFLRKQHSYKPKNGLMPNFGEFARFCRHSNVYVLHGMLTESVKLIGMNETTVASAHNFWLMFITHQQSLGESLR